MLRVMADEQSDLPEGMRLRGIPTEWPPDKVAGQLAWIRAQVATARSMGIADDDIYDWFARLALAEGKERGDLPETTRIEGVEDA
jgi:hypothetical protein